MKTLNCRRPDGSILAVVEVEEIDGVDFYRLRIVEDSGWLSGEDAVTVSKEYSKIVYEYEWARSGIDKTVRPIQPLR